MGIFDPSNGANPRRPISLVSDYQTAMQRATYSPSVAQAAARSGVNPGLATRVAAREVSQNMAGALPGLLSQEAQMMEARRLENERKAQQEAGLLLNVGGQVLGTALNAYAPGASAALGAASSAAPQESDPTGASSAQSNRNQSMMVPQRQQILSMPQSATMAPVSATAVEAAPPPQASLNPITQAYVGQEGLPGFGQTQVNTNGTPVFVAPPNQAQSRRRPRSRS